jgi:hypothetical protein
MVRRGSRACLGGQLQQNEKGKGGKKTETADELTALDPAFSSGFCLFHFTVC